MELRDYVRIVRQRWVLIVGCAVAALAAATALTFQLTPQYSSSARLFVSTSQTNGGDAYQGSLFSQQRVTSYADLVSGQELSARVIKALKLRTTPAALSEKVEATVRPETVILQIKVTDQDPAQAQRLTQAFARQLTRFVSELETPAGGGAAPIKATIVDPAGLPTSPDSPQPVLTLGLAAILGLVVGVGLALLQELLDNSVKTPEDATQAADTPVMGQIGYDSSVGRSPLVTSLGPHAPRVEALRVLRTNLQYVDVDKHSKVFVVTSSVPQEGKTTTAANLAITLAQGGKKVLLLEADLRRPKIAGLLNVEPNVGLTTVLVGRVQLNDAIQEYFAVPNLWVLTSGSIPPNPAELLQSQAMNDVLEKLRDTYDVVIVDAPPLLPVTDAALLTAQSDGALIVVRHGKTTKDQLRHSLERLDAVNGLALGVVLNMVPHRDSGGYASTYDPRYAYRPDRSEAELEPPRVGSPESLGPVTVRRS